MLDLAENVLVFCTLAATTLALTYILNRLWRPEKRREHNEVIGWHLGALGTTYAVILGFMLYTVWTDFGAAQLNLDLEAGSLRNVYNLAGGLPSQQATQLRDQCRLYVDAVLNQDWPTMDRNEVPEHSHATNQAMWETLMSVRTGTPLETMALDHTISELSNMTEHRQTRLLQSAARIPTIFWFVLIVGAIVTLASCALLGSRNALLHTLQVLCFSSLITLVLLAIEDVNRPFSGWVRVSNYAFLRAQKNMADGQEHVPHAVQTPR